MFRTWQKLVSTVPLPEIHTFSHTHTHRDEGMEEVKERERVGMDGGGGESDPRDHGGRKREKTRIGDVGLEGSPSRLE